MRGIEEPSSGVCLDCCESHGQIVSPGHGTAIVRGKVVRVELSAKLAETHKRNAGKRITEQEAIDFVESRGRESHCGEPVLTLKVVLDTCILKRQRCLATITLWR
jgi:hypothetical protein